MQLIVPPLLALVYYVLLLPLLILLLLLLLLLSHVIFARLVNIATLRIRHMNLTSCITIYK